MAAVDITRRLPSKVLDKDVDSLNGLGTIDNYIPIRSEATPDALKQSFEAMLAKQQKETELTILLKAAIDAARQAEWEFHNAVLAMKDSVRGQFGPDSNELQAIGYKKKSEHKRPRRRTA